MKNEFYNTVITAVLIICCTIFLSQVVSCQKHEDELKYKYLQIKQGKK